MSARSRAHAFAHAAAYSAGVRPTCDLKSRRAGRTLARMEAKTHEGSCHCGAVRYEVTFEPPAKAYACNCSICSRAGWLLTFVPQTAFRLLAGEEALVDYQFGKKKIHHQFCKTCGVRAFSRGADETGKGTVAINLRCVAGIDATKLPVEVFDGASL
jgi:hypothetical protein